MPQDANQDSAPYYDYLDVYSAPLDASQDSAPGYDQDASLQKDSPDDLLWVLAAPPTDLVSGTMVFQNGYTWPVDPTDFKLKGEMRKHYLDDKNWIDRCYDRQAQFASLDISLQSLYRVATEKRLWTLPKKTRPSDSDLWYETASMICTACEKRWLNATYDKGNHGPRWIVHKFLHFIDPREVSDEETESYYNDLIENK